MIAFAIVLVIIGAVLLAIASPRKGGNFEIGTSDIKTNLPEITGPAKIPAFILGLVLMGVGLWMGVLLFTKSLEEADREVTENAQPNSTPKVEFEVSPETPIANKPTSKPTDILEPPLKPDSTSPNKIPRTSEEAADLFGGPPAKDWQPCPQESNCWMFILPGSSYRIQVPENCLRPNGSIDGWRYNGGYPGESDSMEDKTRIWNTLEAVTIRCR